MSYPRVEVRWLDAEGCAEQEATDDVLRGAIGIERTDLGYLIRDDAEGVVLSGTEFDGNPKSIDRRVSIPRPYIREIRQLSVKRLGKQKAGENGQTHNGD